MTITLAEVLDLAEQFFDTVAGGGTGMDQAVFFLDPQSQIHIVASGEAIALEDHHTLHAQWTDERHIFGRFNLTVLNTSPDRVRAVGTVYWEARYRDRPAPNLVKAVVGEDWILERLPSGAIKFVLYMNTSHHLLPDSAPLQLE